MVPSVNEGKIVLIANPVSKSGRGAVAASEAARLLRERVGQERFEMLTTAWAGHGESLARELGPDVGCVIAAAAVGLVFLGNLYGIGAGTLVSAFAVGLLIKRLKPVLMPGEQL